MIRKSKLVIAIAQGFKSFVYGIPPLSALQLENKGSYQGKPSLNECSHRLMANQARDIRAPSPKIARRFDDQEVERGIKIQGINPSEIYFDDIDKSAMDIKALNIKALIPSLSLLNDPTRNITNQLTQNLIEKQERVIKDTLSLACSDFGLKVDDVDLFQIDRNNGSRVYAMQVDGKRIDLVSLSDLFHETQGIDNEYYYAKVFCNYNVLYESKYYD